jgi:hypothetical protein
VLGWHRAKICHELAWIGEARDVPEFGNQRRCGHQRHAAQRLQCVDQGGERPVRQCRCNVGFQTVAPCRRRLDRRDAVLQHNVMDRVFEPQSGQPAPVHQRPGRPVVMMAMTQQEAGQLLASLTQRPYRGLTRPHQIADRLMRLIGNPNRRQFTSSMQFGEVDRISPIGLDPLTGPAGISDGATTMQSCSDAVSCR